MTDTQTPAFNFLRTLANANKADIATLKHSLQEFSEDYSQSASDRHTARQLAVFVQQQIHKF